ncbi:MAG TPA: FtsX-like permease family protein [Chitinophagaceae bacterium]|nr:FtsX-like permease family protein [Chitinophagaceae bacterium]
MTSIHLHSDLAEEYVPNGNARTVFFISLIGLFVLIIAWINYVNLSTARALERAREVGVRKVIGAVKKQLILQFLVEAILVNLLSVLIAWGLTSLSLRYFNTISGLELNQSYLIKPWFLGLLAGLWLIGSLLSGFYPALVLSSFKPVEVLKGKLKNNIKGILLRKGLVITQFIASIALIAGTFVVYRQLKYMMNRDMGMNIDQVIVMERPGIADTNSTRYNASIDMFRNELKKSPSIQAVSASFNIPGKQREYKTFLKVLGNTSGDSVIVRYNSMDYHFLDVFQMKLIAGRNFSKEFPKDPDTSIIVTATTAKLLGFAKPEDIINKTMDVPGFNWKPIVIGVVNDYHQVSLKKALDPSIFFCSEYGGEFYSARIKTKEIQATIKTLEKSWTAAFPGNPFSYFFLDDYFNKQYEQERKFEKLFVSFAILAIIIGCLGLFGLSAYTASQRTREIGIRKVLGASVTGITSMLSKDFLKLVIIAILIALPLSWWVMNNWLSDFAYRVKMGWWIFAAAGAIALLIAMLTVSFQAIKAAIANPVKSLRTE